MQSCTFTYSSTRETFRGLWRQIGARTALIFWAGKTIFSPWSSPALYQSIRLKIEYFVPKVDEFVLRCQNVNLRVVELPLGWEDELLSMVHPEPFRILSDI